MSQAEAKISNIHQPVAGRADPAGSPVGYNHIQRPLRGTDILQFRGRHEMDKDDVTYHLAIPNFKKKSELQLLPYELELLMRLYDENPVPAPFKRYRMSIAELFDMMYGKKLAVFKGTEFEVEAKVDFQSRFSKLMGRSKGRAYRWLDESAIKAGSSARTSSDILAILGKLTQCQDPGATLERLGQMIWSLRGEDINQTFPIPTLKNPPRREKRGRRPLKRDDSEVSPKAAKAPVKKATQPAAKKEGIRIRLRPAKNESPAAKAPVKKKVVAKSATGVRQAKVGAKSSSGKARASK